MGVVPGGLHKLAMGGISTWRGYTSMLLAV